MNEKPKGKPGRPPGSKNQSKKLKTKVNTGIYIEEKCLAQLDEHCSTSGKARPEIICKLLRLAQLHPEEFKALLESQSES